MLSQLQTGPASADTRSANENINYNDNLLVGSASPTTMVNTTSNPVSAHSDNAIAPSFTQLQAGEYLIWPQDLLEIQVFGVEELYRKVRVNSRGSISLPLIGTLQAAGLTAEQLEARLAAELSKNYLQDPQVSVFIEEYTNLRVTVEGAVKKPGMFPIQGQATLLQSIALAEGPDRLASSVVKVFRVQPGGERQPLQYDLDDIRAGSIPDPVLQGDDIVVVETSTGKSVIHGVTDTLRGFVRPFGF
jgi:polysaccharide export outer membrane protein